MNAAQLQGLLTCAASAEAADLGTIRSAVAAATSTTTLHPLNRSIESLEILILVS